MKKLWKSFKVLLFFLIYPFYCHSVELNEYGLNHNSFSELQELRTIYYKGDLSYIDPEDTENLDKINEFYLDNYFFSDEIDSVYQFSGDTKTNTFISIGDINDAENKIKNSSIEEAYELNKKIKIKNFLAFEKGKLQKSVFIKNDKYNLFQVNAEKQIYSLYLNSPLKFKDTSYSLFRVNWKDIITDEFEFEVEISPNYTSIKDFASQILVFKIPKLDIFIVSDEKNDKIIYTDENLKKIKYHGEYSENDDLQNPSSFLNPTLLNFLPTEFKKVLNKAREINSNYPINFTLNELINLITNVETLNADNINFAKQKESELQSLIQKKQDEIKAEKDKIKAEEFRAAQLEEQKAQEERQKILDQQAEEENQRLLAEYAAADAAEKRQKYIQYGLIILLIGGLIAFIFFTNFLDNLQKFLKQIFSKFKKKKLKSYLPKDFEKKNKKNKKTLGYWVADWANSYEDPRSAYYIVTATLIVTTIIGFIYVGQVNKNPESTGLVVFGWIIIITFFISGYLAFKIHSGISTYHCPKCKRIYAGEIYKQIHLGSRQQAAKFRVTEKRRIKYRDHPGFTKYNDYEVEKDEYGTEQIDTYLNKTKCLLCNHKWEYNSSSATRVA